MEATKIEAIAHSDQVWAQAEEFVASLDMTTIKNWFVILESAEPQAMLRWAAEDEATATVFRNLIGTALSRLVLAHEGFRGFYKFPPGD